MITRIVLENFMSHRHTVIEPAAGLTLLVGPNNCGKSAVVTALQVLMENERAERFVRHGAKSSLVRVETSEGHVIEWRRDKAVSYKVNGREVHRLRGGIPEDLDEVLRMKPVSGAEGGDEFQVHIAEQKRPIFLIDEPAGRAATFFASSSDTRLLLQMQQLHKERRSERKKEAERLQGQVRATQEQLDRFGPLAGIQESLARAERDQEALTASRETVRKGIELLSALVRLQAIAQLHRVTFEVLQAVTPPPELPDPMPLSTLTAAMERRSRQLQKSQATSQQLDRLAHPPLLAETEGLAQAVHQIRRATSKWEATRSRSETLAQVEPPPMQLPTEDLAQVIHVLKGSAERARTARLACDTLAVLTEVPTLSDTFELQRDLNRMEACATNLAQAAKVAAQADEALKALQADIRKFVTEHPKCPLCGGPMTEDSVITGGHRHG